MGTVNHGFTLCDEKGYGYFEGFLIKILATKHHGEKDNIIAK